jgi:hypothetical protein
MLALGLVFTVADVVPMRHVGDPHPAYAAPVTTPTNPGGTIPLLAYYYIWFDTSSWRRAKTDFPLLGAYSSDDTRVLRQHVEWAKSAGIDGFIVGWKDTPTNDRRLRLLMTVAKEENFKLVVIYQSLDFERHPLPIERVRADFVTFRDQFAGDPVFFRLGGKPVTIWSGTWSYSYEQVASVTGVVRPGMLVLSTEKNVADYRRLAAVTDGDSYYWSSANPESNDNYVSKLKAMGEAAHRDGNYWFAPFAPGFDARMVGGGKVVDRAGGQTLRTEYAAAVYSSPDVLGLISWNEFSENSHVEPSQKYGHQFLDVLRELRRPPAPSAGADDSSQPSASGNPSAPGRHRHPLNLALLVSFFVLLVVGSGLLGRSRRRRDIASTASRQRRR